MFGYVQEGLYLGESGTGSLTHKAIKQTRILRCGAGAFKQCSLRLPVIPR